MNVLIRTDKALALLKANREKHKIEFAKQLVGWQEEMNEYYKLMKLWSDRGGTDKRPEVPDKPWDQAKEYDELIERLGHHEGTAVSLDKDDFDRIVRDNFRWRAGFIANSTKYIK